MANKKFGVKEFTLIGSSGSPTIQSPNNINLVANTVAISTNLTVGSDLTVTNNLVSNNITVSNLSITNVAGVTTIVNLNATTANISGVSTFAGITTVTGSTLFSKQLNVSGVSTFRDIISLSDSSSTYVVNARYDQIAGFQVGAGYWQDRYLILSNNLNYILRNVGIGTTNPVSGYNLTLGNDSSLGRVSNSLKVHGYGDINGLIIKGNSTTGTGPYYTDNVVITQHPASTFTGGRNVAIGDYSFTTPGAAGENVAIGYYALNIVGNNDTLSTWNGNTAVGAFAGQSGTTTLRNTFIGYGAGRYVTTGDENTILGSYNGNQNDLDIRTSSNNVVLSDGAGNIRLIANAAGNVGLGTTNPTSKLTVKGNTSLETLSVSGISTLNGLLISNDGGNNGSVLIEDAGAYSQISFRASNGTTQAQIQGVESNLYIGSGSGGNISLGTYSIFYPNGNVILNNGNQGTTLIRNQVHVQSGITSFYDNVSVGGTISVDGGVTLATNNTTIVGTSGTAGEIKQIAGAPFFYDGSAWREFVLSSGTPVTQPADTEWDNVIFRATFDDDYTDAKFGATPVYIGTGSSVVGAAVTIGTGSLRLNGQTGAGISYAYRPEFDLTGSWTIEFWMYHDDLTNTPFNGNVAETIVSFGSTTPSGPSSGFKSLAISRDSFANISFYWYNNQNVNPLILYNTSGSAYNSTSVQKWRHYALVREGDNGSLHFYIDGVESASTYIDGIIDNNILNEVGDGLYLGSTPVGIAACSDALNSVSKLDAYLDDVRISAGVGTAGQRYNSVGIYTSTTFTPPTTQLPITGTLTSVVNPPGDKYGEITLGGSPTWRGTSGVTVTQQSSGNYRVSFASSYTNSNDYYVLSQGMDQGFASYVGIARSTTHVDLSINRQSNDAAVDTGALAVQIKNHI